MRKLTPILVTVLATAVPAVAAAPVQARPPKPRAELVTKKVSALIASGRVTAGATVKNKGNKKAGATVATFYLSDDTKQSGDDVTLGTAAVGKLKPKKSKPVSAAFSVPSSVLPGAYHVVVCADSGGVVRERKEANNCKGSRSTVQVGSSGPGAGQVAVSATAGPGGDVAASGITGGTCPGNVCTFTSGAGKVTFTPTPAAGHRFGAWSGATCTGFTTGPGNAITFTDPTSSKACTVTFVATVTISWSVSGGIVPPLEGSVTATSVTGGSCTANGPTGTCTLDSGASSVTLTASAGLPPVLTFGSWGPAVSASCAGTTSGASGEVETVTNPTSNQSCVAAYSLII